jgi:hypothetical protein
MYFCEHYKTCNQPLLVENPWSPCRLTSGIEKEENIYDMRNNVTFCRFHGGNVKILTEFEKLFLEALNETDDK